MITKHRQLAMGRFTGVSILVTWVYQWEMRMKFNSESFLSHPHPPPVFFFPSVSSIPLSPFLLSLLKRRIKLHLYSSNDTASNPAATYAST
jgi:hypothetical protein